MTAQMMLRAARWGGWLEIMSRSDFSGPQEMCASVVVAVAMTAAH